MKTDHPQYPLHLVRRELKEASVSWWKRIFIPRKALQQVFSERQERREQLKADLMSCDIDQLVLKALKYGESGKYLNKLLSKK